MNLLRQHSLFKSIILHLIPGLVGTIAYILITPFLMESGYPAILGILISAAVIILPIELGYLLYLARKINGSFSLKGIVLNREVLPKWQYVVIPLGLVVWGFLATWLTPLLDNIIANSWFSWLPNWYFIFDPDQLQEYARPELLLTFWVGLVVNGFMLPFVEEYYFRGYLLPRINRNGKWAPFINLSLFSLYHFWTPWQFISRIILLLPWVYVAWRKRNIYLIIITHCTANVLGWLLTWGLILG